MPSEIEVSCPGCNAVFSVPVELSGEIAECTECAAVFEIPRLDEHPDAIDTDTGAIKGIFPAAAPASDYTSTATNTVKLSRSSIGMIPTLKDSFTFGQKEPGTGFGAPQQPQQQQSPQASAWGAQPGMQPQPRMAPPPPPPPPARPAPQMAPPPQQQPRLSPPPPSPAQQQMAPPSAHQGGGVASMLGAAPAQAQQQAPKPTFTRPPQPPQPPQARPAPAPSSSSVPAHAPTSSTQGVPAQHVSIKLPAWTKVQFKQGEEAVAYKELNKNPAISAVLASIPVMLSGIAVVLNQIVLGLIIVGVLGAVTFIVAFVMSKEGAKRAIILTTQRAICIFGKDRIELKK